MWLSRAAQSRWHLWKRRNNPPWADREQLKKKYLASSLSHEDDTFLLCRVIGNDLVPRHAKGQSKDNLGYILDNEPELLFCEKYFVINRIIDPDEERKIIDLLESSGAPYFQIKFNFDEYKKIPLDIS